MKPIHHPELDDPTWQATAAALRRAAKEGRFVPPPFEEYSPPRREEGLTLGWIALACIVGAAVAALGLLIYRLPAIREAVAAFFGSVGP